MIEENKLLIAERKARNLSRAGMARYLGIDATAYNEIERGERIPAKVTRNRISQQLGIPEEILFIKITFTKVCIQCGYVFEAKHSKQNKCETCRAIQRPPAASDKPRRRTAQSIAEIAVQARAAGMSYGKYVAWKEGKV